MQIAQVIGSSAEFAGQSITLKDDTRVSLESVLSWPEAERNAAGLYSVADPDVPAGHRLVLTELTFKKGQGVTAKALTEPMPVDKRAEARAAFDTAKDMAMIAIFAGEEIPADWKGYGATVGQIALDDKPRTEDLPEAPELFDMAAQRA